MTNSWNRSDSLIREAQRNSAHPQLPQLYSRDGYVRISLDDLQHLTWHALYCSSDVAEEQGHSGEVEWSAVRGSDVLSLGWDWQRDGEQRPAVQILAGLRTNIWVQDARGYDLSYQDSQANLLRLIEQINWAALVYAGH